jgi:hypothetical protein
LELLDPIPDTLANATNAIVPKSDVVMSPTQETAFAALAALTQSLPVTVLCGAPGSGKTTILRELQRRFGGRLISLRDMLEVVATRPEVTIEEALLALVEQEFVKEDVVMIDNLSSIEMAPRMTGAYARPFFFDAVKAALFETARALGKHIVAGFSADIGYQSYASLQNQGVHVEIAPYTALDYATIIGHVLGTGNLGNLHFDAIYSHARQPAGYQLEIAPRFANQLSRLIPPPGLLQPHNVTEI